MMPRSITRCTPNVLQTPKKQWFVDYLPVTGNNSVALLIDGQNYGQALYDELSKAKRQVLLTGLHFDPEWSLVRPGPNNETYSLSNVLRSVAQRGIEIYLIVNQFWIDEAMADDFIRNKIIDAGHLDWYLPKTIQLFKQLKDFPNVHCRTDVHSGCVMSTHHQKTVVIDEQVCFVGGIDLTAVDGDRWDNNHHKIENDASSESRNSQLPEKLWHDVHCKITGPAVRFVLDNFHARWNYGRLYKRLIMQRRIIEQSFPDSKDNYVEKVTYKQMYMQASDDEKNRYMFTRIPTPEGVYQNLTRNEFGAPLIVSRGTVKTDKVKCGLSALDSLPGVKIQVVRSMPYGRYIDGEQKPDWNLSTLEWERSCKDAYLVGIRAASSYIYLENQWVSDEDIWEELLRAMRRNKNNPDFRIVIMIPRNPLTAAGYGSNQDIDLSDEIGKVISATTIAAQFGMYCIVAPIPPSREQDLPLTSSDHNNGRTEAQIYVHSKILIIDDKWALIGSANAGGISLEGVSNPLAPYRGATPDAELSVIIYDETFAADFRRQLWMEHLQDKSAGSLPVHKAADLFREKAGRDNQRVRFSSYYQSFFTQNSSTAIRRVSHDIVDLVRKSAQLESSAGSTVNLRTSNHEVFTVLLKRHPGPGYNVSFRWSLRDKDNQALLMRGLPGNRIVQTYGVEYRAYIPTGTKQLIRSRTQKPQQGRVLCRVMIIPVGVRIRHSGDDQSQYSFLLELPVKLIL